MFTIVKGELQLLDCCDPCFYSSYSTHRSCDYMISDLLSSIYFSLLLFISLSALPQAHARQKPHRDCCLSKLLMSNTDLEKSQSEADVTATMDLNLTRTHHACTPLSLSEAELYLLISHAALVFQPVSIGAVCSNPLHFYCSHPSLFSTHLHLRSAQCGPHLTVAALYITSLSPPGFSSLILCPS